MQPIAAHPQSSTSPAGLILLYTSARCVSAGQVTVVNPSSVSVKIPINECVTFQRDVGAASYKYYKTGQAPNGKVCSGTVYSDENCRNAVGTVSPLPGIEGVECREATITLAGSGEVVTLGVRSATFTC